MAQVSKAVNNLFQRCIVMAAEQTLRGAKINVESLDTLEAEGKETVAQLEAELTEKYGVNPNSTDQLLDVLTQQGFKFTKTTKKGNTSLDKAVLEAFGLLDILEYRQAQKLDSSFVGKVKSLLRSDGILPHRQIMMGAETGRSTMSDFNWQQAGKKGPVKPLLISRFIGGVIGNVDLSQAELRVLAYLSNDEKFAQIFSQEDPHRSNASRAFNVPYDQVTKSQRSDSKTVVFRAVYGGRPQNAAQERVRDFYEQEYPKAWAWLAEMQKVAKKQGYIEDPYGKIRNLLRIRDNKGLWAVGRAGVNFPIQSVASHCAMTILLHCWEMFKEYKLRSLVLFNVHDSCVFDIHPEEIEQVIWIVRRAFTLLWEWPIAQFPLFRTLPIAGDLMMGPTWGSVEEENKAWINPPKYPCTSLDREFVCVQ